MVKESKHSLWGCLGTLIGPWSLALAFGHVHTSYVVYVHEGVPMFHTSYDMGNSINCGSMYFVLGGVSPGRELLVAPS